MASSDSVGFPRLLRFAPHAKHLNDAVFRRESFLSSSVGCPWAFAPCKLPAPFGWESLPDQLGF